MELVNYCKLQTGCLIIVLFLTAVYLTQRRRYGTDKKFTAFNLLLITGIVSIIFDGVTAVTVNSDIPGWLNLAFHAVFLISLDSVMFSLFLYMLSFTGGLPKSTAAKVALSVPYAAAVIGVLAGLGQLEFVQGEVTNYSMGVSVYACFAVVGAYTVLSAAVFFGRWNRVERRKRVNVVIYLFIVLSLTVFQAFVPQALVTSITTTALILGAYLNQENPALKELEHNHTEMVTGFATLVENRDASTGGHVRRTTEYVRLIAEGLIEDGQYKRELSKEYVDNLIKAAPLHDVGKIAVPDAVLQKPGRLTAEEFEIIKTHAPRGGEIIRETFGDTGDKQYCALAENVARHHHEKWNGNGYPDGLKGEEIPLCARIMAVADVFDAVSERRCYRDAMPLDECFKIIEDGKGRDFEPAIADAFLKRREEVEKIHSRFQGVKND
ncbi:MAG: HD-GYP domain-containing protein [Candidatus Coproplasma sp.]